MADNKTYRFFYHYGYFDKFPHSKHNWKSTEELIEVTKADYDKIVRLDKETRCDTHSKTWYRPVMYLRVPKGKTVIKSLQNG